MTYDFWNKLIFTTSNDCRSERNYGFPVTNGVEAPETSNSPPPQMQIYFSALLDAIKQEAFNYGTVPIADIQNVEARR